MLKNIRIILPVFILFACNKSSESANSTTSGTGGSLARFTIAANHLYTLSNNHLRTYDISDAANPVEKSAVGISDAETIFPYGDKLFIGSSTGIYIYSIVNADKPELLAMASHLRACDPVVANTQYSFSTLRSSGTCGTAVPGLYIYDITDITKPLLKKTVSLTTPLGLGLNNNTLYVCCGEDGLTILDVTHAGNPVEKRTIKNNEFYYDVIVADNLLICYVKSGLLLYDITDANNPIFLTRISS
jgi:hypothetical protein